MNRCKLITTLFVALIFSTFSSPLVAKQPNQNALTHQEQKPQVIELFLKQAIVTQLNIMNQEPNQNASFPNWERFLKDFLVYPDLARENSIEGTVKVEINISSEGDVETVTLVQGLGYGCDEAVVDLVKHMPRWSPRLKQGKPAAQTFVLPVSFKLEE